MSEPRRLSLETDDETERMLLRAGRPRAPRGARERAWVAASGALASSGLAAGSAAAKAGAVVGVKLIAVMGITGLAAVGGAIALQQRHETSVAARAPESAPAVVRRAPTVVAKPPLVPPAVTPAPVASVDVEPPPVASVVVVAPSRKAAPPAPAPSESVASSVPTELAALQQARAALASGDAPQALELLDAYGARFPHGAMAQEATVVRIEALVRAGDRDAAHRAADAFLGAYPQSPYADRIRTLLGTNP